MPCLQVKEKGLYKDSVAGKYNIGGNGMSKDKDKKVYACKVCNAYLTNNADEPTPLCCGKAMLLMDELSEDDIHEEKSSSSGI